MWKIVNFKNWEMYISEFCLVDYPFKKKKFKDEGNCVFANQTRVWQWYRPTTTTTSGDVLLYTITTVLKNIAPLLVNQPYEFPRINSDPPGGTHEGKMIYHLVMTNSSPWYRWPIEIDGLPINSMVIFHSYSGFTYWKLPFIDGLPIKNGGSFHGELLVITRWYMEGFPSCCPNSKYVARCNFCISVFPQTWISTIYPEWGILCVIIITNEPGKFSNPLEALDSNVSTKKQ